MSVAKTIIALAAFALAATAGYAATGEPEEPQYLILAPVGTEAPDFTVELLDGSKFMLSDIRGKTVVLNFWATWCPYCIKELEMVEADFMNRYGEYPVVFLAVSRGEKPATVAKYVEKAGYSFPVALDPDEKIFAMYADKAIPRTFIIDSTGVVRHAGIGYDEALYQEMIEILDEILKTGHN